MAGISSDRRCQMNSDPESLRPSPPGRCPTTGERQVHTEADARLVPVKGRTRPGTASRPAKPHRPLICGPSAAAITDPHDLPREARGALP